MNASSSSLKMQHQTLIKISFVFLLALLFITPLAFSLWVENSFTLVKKSSLIIIGGFFIITTVILFTTKFIKKDELYIFVDKRIDPFILLFLNAALLSTLFSIKPYISMFGSYTREIGFMTYLFLGVIYFISSQLFQNEQRKETAVNTMVITAAIVSLYGIMQYLALDPFETPLIGGSRPVSTLGHSIFTGGFLAIVFPLSVYKALTSKPKLQWSLSSLLILAGIFVTQSRSAYAAAIAVIFIFIAGFPFIYRDIDKAKFRKSVKISLLLFIVLFSGIALSVAFYSSHPFVHKLLKISELPNSARWILWRDSFEAYKVHPFTGSGVGTFATIFEYFSSYQLKLIEPKNIFDNAHNIYINTLVTMGAVGLISYLLLITSAIITSMKGFISKASAHSEKMFFLSAGISLISFAVYGLAGFEDISILLYFFIILALVKAGYSKSFKSALTGSEKFRNSIAYLAIYISIPLTLFCMYNFYTTVIELSADSHYKEANIFYTKNDFKGAVNELNKAVTINPENGDYKFTLAAYVSDFCLKNPEIKPETKNNLLKQAEEELERARVNFFSHLQNKALLSIIKFQQGNITEGEKLRLQVFHADSLLLWYRNNMAKYYYISGDTVKMLGELRAVLFADKYNPDAVIGLASYYSSIGEKNKALNEIDHYLEKYPLNPYVLNLRERILAVPDKK
jgi:O-antigen ligase